MKLTNHINKIAFTEGNRDCITWDLTSVKQINFFIGPNNSGKSRKLRQFFLLKKDKIIFDTDLLSVQQCLDHWKNSFTSNQEMSIITHTRRHLSEFISAVESIIENNRPIGIYQLNQAIIENVYGSNRNGVSSIENHLIEPVKRSNESGHVVLDKINQIKNWHSVYIPTLRSLRNIHDTDAFHQRTTTDYFPGSSLKEMIFTGHTLYDDVKAHLLGSHEEREKVRKYEKYLSKSFFFGQDIALVPRIDTDVVYFKEGDREERPIYDLGDGIQSIIMLTYPIFMATKPTMFFIEEPELYLHAGLQRTLVETYANHKEHMFYITTHSNHFLDIAQERDDVSIQQVRQSEEGETEVTPAAEFEELLTELGVRASSVLLANCSIWVEGITDKLYLRTYLNKYIEELREKGYEQKANQLSSYHENLHFVFTEYQGSNITHWYFGESNSGEHINSTPARKLNHKILLIADADIDGKGDRVEMLKQDLGDSFILLDWKEIENYIPQEIIIKTAEARWNTFNGKKECKFNSSNITQVGLFEKNNEGIGRTLERYVQKPKELKRNFYSDDSGTIKDKVKFCHTAIEIMNSEDTDWKLTLELTKLCERIWAHVIDSNK
ncbi:AAA family ATPase [Vibrio parahaemolyticus]|uniref:AAA family ATPase n=1 Tax=Vibrio parahaemolyticus TaxID=670 RepID=UPI002361C902|nr:AAA family ATPase [Vibrio parahaemolyticus]